MRELKGSASRTLKSHKVLYQPENLSVGAALRVLRLSTEQRGGRGEEEALCILKKGPFLNHSTCGCARKAVVLQNDTENCESWHSCGLRPAPLLGALL